MKRIWLAVFVIGLWTYTFYEAFDNCVAKAAGPPKKAGATAKPATGSCKECHKDFTSILPEGHSEVEGRDLAACTSCHEPDLTGNATKNPFSTRMHLAHVAPKGKLECTACHKWIAGKSFTLIGHKVSWGRPTKDHMSLIKEIFLSWAGSRYTDSLHAKAGVGCTGCHGKNPPKVDDTVENARCLTCHGPMDQLAKKTEPIEFKDRNPHKSHLGDINCAVCHYAHSESKAYCLSCHQNFGMQIPGAAKQ